MTGRVVFDYMYCDAGNYKACGALLLTGEVTEDDRKRVISKLSGGGFFIAEQVGIPVLYGELWEYSGGPTEDDHVWHTFNLFRPPMEEDGDLPVWGTVSELVERFEKVAFWRENLSPYWDIRMQASSVFHEDVFYEYFRPFRHPSASFDVWGGHGLETFGADLIIVKDYAQEFVWTVVDGSDDSDQWILPGYHHINRICYLLTELAHDWAPLEFRIARGPHSLTPLGLARRVSALKRIMSAQATESILNPTRPAV